MRRHVWIAGLALAALGTAAAAPAPRPAMLGFVDAAALSGFCTATGEKAGEGRMVCLSYITGAVDQLLADQAMRAPDDRTICVPGDVTAEAVMKSVATHATWSKSAKGVSAAGFVKFAMEAAYPCNPADARIM
jgi:hypothetical protein